MKRLIILAGLTATLSGPAMADICAYKPSRLIGAGTTGVISTGSASLAAVGLSMKAAGFYTLTYAASGAAMLASTAGGASAAGTVGIMGGDRRNHRHRQCEPDVPNGHRSRGDGRRVGCAIRGKLLPG